jgi:ribosomal protein S18 acetylase RimI-like enzyme
MIRLRGYRSTDLVRLYELDQVCFARDIAYSLPELRYFLNNPRCTTWIAESIATDTPDPVAGGISKASDQTQFSSKEGSLRGPWRACPSRPPALAGFIIIERARRDGKQIGRIITIDVAECTRRLGVGSLLVEAAEEQLRKEGVNVLTLEVAEDNKGARAFYRRLGFSTTGRIPKYYAGRWDALVMEKGIC